MKHLLAPLVGDASPVTVIGLCKNAGKTTAMRRLMAELGEECLLSLIHISEPTRPY